jgi:hypothetical protein
MLFVFFALAVIILPEYRYSMLTVFVLYSVLLFFILRISAGEHLSEFRKIIFSRRSYFIFRAFIASAVIFFLSLVLLNTSFFNGLFLDISANGLLSLDPDTRTFLESLDEDVELVYVRSLKDNDESILFDAMLKEFESVSGHISHRIIHPVINATDHEKLKNLVPSASPGSVVSMSRRDVSVADKITEEQLALSIYRALEGKRKVCVSHLNGEPGLDDYAENGAAIMHQVMRDRGIELIPVDIDEMDTCSSFIIFEPQLELASPQMNKVLSYKGNLVILGGGQLESIRKILSSLGLSVGKNINPEFGLGAFRDYSGLIVVDKISNHPVSKALGGTITARSAFELTCDACQIIAAVSSNSGGKISISPVFVVKKGLLVSSLDGMSKNFFMRFKGNSELLINSLSFLISKRYPYINSVPSVDVPKIFAVSTRYMKIIFMVVVWIIPLLYLLLGVYCFSKNRSS